MYLMRNGEGLVIYVGKAANLRSRVRSYFGSPASMAGKTRLWRRSWCMTSLLVDRTALWLAPRLCPTGFGITRNGSQTTSRQ